MVYSYTSCPGLRYILIGVLRRQLPTAALFWIMRLRGDGNLAEQTPDLLLQNWQSWMQQNGRSFTGLHVVEIGSGRYARFGLHLLKAGARRVTLVDFYALPVDHPQQRERLRADCRKLGLSWDEVRARLRVIRGDILALNAGQLGEAADMVFSTAVLEHVRDPQAILARCRTWLRPGGISVHMVDLRDHNLQFRYPFEMLTFSDATWERWLNLGGGFYVNRWRAHDYVLAMAEAGFERVTYEVTQQDRAGAQAIRPRLNRRFAGLPDAVLGIEMLYLYGRKPGGEG